MLENIFHVVVLSTVDMQKFVSHKSAGSVMIRIFKYNLLAFTESEIFIS